mgnify:CR=1 FL=1
MDEHSWSSTKIVGRKRRLPTAAKRIFDEIFHSGGGWVLDFSDRTMSEWFDETFDVPIFQEQYQSEGASKGKTLRGFVEVAEPKLVARVLRALWAYRCSLPDYVDDDAEQELTYRAWITQFTKELEELSSFNFDQALPNFSDDISLPKLRGSIANDLISGNPDVAIDRLHTYCVKRFRHLLKNFGEEFDPKTALHALFGAYGKVLKEGKLVSEYALPTLRVQHKLFESLNSARNERSFAHDAPLLDVSEAQYIVDSVVASLAFIERIEVARQSSS